MGLGSEEHERVEVGSGSTMETSGECDDEDGCQGSGENEDAIGEAFSLLLWSSVSSTY